MLLIDDKAWVIGIEISGFKEILGSLLIQFKGFVGKPSPEEGEGIIGLCFNNLIEVIEGMEIILDQ